MRLKNCSHESKRVYPILPLLLERGEVAGSDAPSLGVVALCRGNSWRGEYFGSPFLGPSFSDFLFFSALHLASIVKDSPGSKVDIQVDYFTSPLRISSDHLAY